MAYPFFWALNVFSDFIDSRKFFANRIMRDRDLSVDDVVNLIRSDQPGWNAFKKAVKAEERAHEADQWRTRPPNEP